MVKRQKIYKMLDGVKKDIILLAAAGRRRGVRQPSSKKAATWG
jgi:hypothetical protein